MVVILAVGLTARNLDTNGKAWLNIHSEAAAVDVNGQWHAEVWGLPTRNPCRAVDCLSE